MRSVKCGYGITRGHAKTESVLFWGLLSGYKCAEIHEAMAEISGLKYSTKKQYVEMGTSVRINNFIGLMKAIHCLPAFNTYFLTDPNLQCLQSGQCSSKFNCANNERIGANKTGQQNF